MTCGQPHPDRPGVQCDKPDPCTGYHANAPQGLIWPHTGPDGGPVPLPAAHGPRPPQGPARARKASPELAARKQQAAAIAQRARRT